MAKLINILLRKTDPDYPWGFTLGALPPALHSIQITWVDTGSLASEHLEPGDRVLEIEGIDTTMLSNSEVESMLTSPSNKLELLIMKKGRTVQNPVAQNQGGSETLKTVKIKDTITSTTEESGQTKILNEDYLEGSRILKTDGALHRQVMETTECSEKELKTDTSFWTCPPSDLVKQDGKKKLKEQILACRNTSGSGYISDSAIFKSLNNYRDELRKIDPREEKRQFWESCRKGDTVRRFKWGDSVKLNRETSPAYKSDGSMESLYSKSESQTPIPKMERSKSCEPMDSLPTSNPFSEPFPGEFQRHAGVSQTNPFYKEFESLNQMNSSLSSDFKSFKSIESEFKTGQKEQDDIKISSTTCFDDRLKHENACGSTASNFHNFNDEYRIPWEKNGKVSTTSTEQFIKHEGNATESNTHKTVRFDETNDADYLNDSLKCNYACSTTSSELNDFKDERRTNALDQCEDFSSTENGQFLKHENESHMNNSQKTVRFDVNIIPGSSEINYDVPKTQSMRFTKAMGKEEFETKCKFFEKATSVPVLSANKNAKDLVEERLKEGTPSSPSMSPSIARKTPGSSSGIVNSFPNYPVDDSNLHLLKKPSDFINQQFKSVTSPDRPIPTSSQHASQVVPVIKVSEHSEKEESYDETRYNDQPTHYQKSNNSSSLPGVVPIEKSAGFAWPQPVYANIENEEMSYDETRYKDQPTCYQKSNGSSSLPSVVPIDKSVGFACPQPVYANMSEHIANYKSTDLNQKTTDNYQGVREHTSSTHGGSENKNSTDTRKPTASEHNIVGDFRTRNYVGVSQPKLVSGTVKRSESSWDENQSSYGSSRSSEVFMSSRQSQMFHDPMSLRSLWFTGGMSPAKLQKELVGPHGSGSLDQDFYEKRSFKESSFEKVTRSSNSPYENVESASSKEYEEESGPSKNITNRSKTPADFYDNSNIDDIAKEIRAKSPLDISSKSYEDIRNRLGSLLGATPVNISCERSKLLISRGGIDHVEEAFHKLALQEGIVGSTSDHVARP